MNRLESRDYNVIMDDCEVCNAREVVGFFDLGGVETPLCAYCSSVRNLDGSVFLDGYDSITDEN